MNDFYTDAFFDRYHERRGTRSVKWDDYHEVYSLDRSEEILPMWVADMDFLPPVEVTAALAKRAESGMLGYSFAQESVYESVRCWLLKRHGWQIKKEWIVFTPGVVPGINIAYQQFSEPGDGIIVQPPVYYPFMNGIKNNERRLVTNALIETDSGYVMDFDLLADQVRMPGNRILVLCNPHNPVGRCWSREELERVGRLCVENNVLLISDEIHADLIMTGISHQTVGTLPDEIRDHSILFFAPSKTFNLAGLQTAYAVIPDPKIRKQFENGMQRFGLFGINIFGQIALETAYTQCAPYADAVCAYVDRNMNTLAEYIGENQPRLSMKKPEGTYLAWVDFRKTGMRNQDLERWILKEARIGVDFGRWFGAGGEGYLRFNLACPHQTLKEAINRMDTAMKYVNAYLK